MPIAKSWEATSVFSIEVIFFFCCLFKQVMIGSEYCLCMRKVSFRDAYLKVLRQIREVCYQNREITNVNNAWHIVVIQSKFPKQATCDTAIFKYAQ